jgi:phage-related holin
VIGFYIANEGISILENAGELGIPLPKKLIAVLKQLKSKDDEESEDDKHDSDS